MKKINLLLILVIIVQTGFAQQFAPKIVEDSLYSASLENNGGENPTRTMLIYLPPGYEENTEKRMKVFNLDSSEIGRLVHVTVFIGELFMIIFIHQQIMQDT